MKAPKGKVTAGLAWALNPPRTGTGQLVLGKGLLMVFIKQREKMGEEECWGCH